MVNSNILLVPGSVQSDVPSREALALPERTYTIVMLFPGHMLTDHLAHGDGLVAFGFIAELAKRGHRLHVIVQRSSFAKPLPPNVTIYSAPASSRPGIRERLAFVLRSRLIVRRLLGVGNIDVVHQLNPVCNGMSLGAVGLHVPIVLGTYVSNWPEPAARRGKLGSVLARVKDTLRTLTYRLQEHGAAAFLLTSPAASSRLSSPTGLASRIHWLPNGIDVNAFAPGPLVAGAEKTILFLASVEKKKGILTLLEAFAIVRATIPESRLIIGGSGELSAEVATRVAALPYADAIEIVGRVERTGVAELMAKCAVYCLPSFGEPYGMTVIEAMACGKPVVVTDGGGVRDLVDDAGGRRVEPGNAQQLADALIEILNAPGLQASMATFNRMIAEREYNWPHVIAKLEAVYALVGQAKALR
jgi:glycosyltransferase involved in cell wall biosynthesis